MIAAVGVRSECGLMLAAKKDGSLNCYLAERLTGSIDDFTIFIWTSTKNPRMKYPGKVFWLVISWRTAVHGERP